ncbi:hypothetical protein I7I50_08490 [Histoplasma capsulatum G186AR]|uniref:Uncharacterized protein n=1 Tax=Ajellomyces capsulatus TaxID=5037 RepID=A0A8H8D0Q8_AJECA|nr:hypothetical protein I7I52_06005 [Histoplasma capsulatum]QSS73634.1 hypothetical protein I7I50_08490 [Histoplasma capsulatum G186AR]
MAGGEEFTGVGCGKRTNQPPNPISRGVEKEIRAQLPKSRRRRRKKVLDLDMVSTPCPRKQGVAFIASLFIQNTPVHEA